MNDEDVNLEVKLIEFRKQKWLENEIKERSKVKREVIEKEKIEDFRHDMKIASDLFISSFKYSIPIGISQMAILKSLVVFPIIHFGIFFYKFKTYNPDSSS